MELLSVIRRWHYRDHFSIREISRRTGLSRNTVRKYLRSDTVEPKFNIPDRPSKLDPYADKLSQMLRQEPQSLVADGRCSGRARITLVYAPPLDPAFGAEFVRVNLEASLKQRQAELASDGSIRFTNQIAARYLPKSTHLAIPEKALIDHGLKWWPTKQYESTFVENGVFSQWRLEVTSLVRAEAQFPAEGVPFAVILT